MKQATVDTLCKYQRFSLRVLELGPYNWKASNSMSSIATLQTLCIRSLTVIERVEPSFLAVLIGSNPHTLRALHLGVETTLVKSYIAGDVYDNTNPNCQMVSRIRAQVDSHFMGEEGPAYLPGVETISLHGLDMCPIFSCPGRPLIDLGALKEMTLESCCSLDAAFTTLGNSQLPNLENLYIRQEGVNDQIFALLTTFLCALPPLMTLFVLLEGDIHQFDLGTILQKHGESLRRLIIDVRRGNRSSVQHSKTIWRPQNTDDIAQYCPNLVELGIPIHWKYMGYTSRGRRTV